MELVTKRKTRVQQGAARTVKLQQQRILEVRTRKLTVAKRTHTGGSTLARPGAYIARPVERQTAESDMYEPNKATRRRDWGSRTYNQSLARPRGTHLRTHLCIMCQRSQWTEPPATTPTAVQKHRLKRHQQHRQEGNEQHPRTRSGHTRLPTRIYGAHLVSSTHQRNRPRE